MKPALSLLQAVKVKPTSHYIWRQLLARTTEARTYMIRGTDLKVAIRHRSADVANLGEVFVRDIFELPPEVKRVLPSSRPIRAVDLGAFIGLFGISLLAEHPDAEIVAVEPDPASRTLLEHNAALNSRVNAWKVIGACAGVAAGTVTFNATGSMGSHIATSGNSGIPVDVIDVFSLMENVDLVKIDVEGAEGPILNDPRLRNISAVGIFLEYHRPLGFAAVAGPLDAAGFRVVSHTERPGAGELWATRG